MRLRSPGTGNGERDRHTVRRPDTAEIHWRETGSRCPRRFHVNRRRTGLWRARLGIPPAARRWQAAALRTHSHLGIRQ